MSLRRVLGTADAAWLVAGNMIGAGIFLTPGLVAGRLPGLGWQFAAWIVGAGLALLGASVYGELGARLPHAGGDYQYLSAALGPAWGFLTAWGAFVATFTAAAAAMADVAVDHLRVAWPGTLEGDVAGRIASAAVVLILTGANVLGARASSRATLVLTALPVAGLAALLVVGAVRGDASATWPAEPFRAPPGPAWAAFGAAMLPVFFTYSGWNAAAYVAGEIESPGRSLPRGLLVGTSAVAVLYLALVGAFAVLVPPEALRGSTTAGAAAARALVGPGAERWVAALVVPAVLASINVTLMAGARIYYAAASDRLAPRAFARTNRAGVPHVALWAAGLWSMALAALADAETLVSWTTLAILVLSSLTASALFVLRRRDPGGTPFRCPGHPWSTAAYIGVTLAVAAAATLGDRERATGNALGVVILAAGLPLYAWFRRRAR